MAGEEKATLRYVCISAEEALVKRVTPIGKACHTHCGIGHKTVEYSMLQRWGFRACE